MPSPHLPAPLRGSRLPWEPGEDQAAVPRDGDTWTALVGPYHCLLDVDAHELTIGVEEGRWSLQTLEEASSKAEETLNTLLQHARAAAKLLGTGQKPPAGAKNSPENPEAPLK